MMAKDWHTHAQQQYVRLNDQKITILVVPHERPWNKYNFSWKIWQQACLVFVLLALKKSHCKNFYFLHYDILAKILYTILYVRTITVKHFHIVTHNYSLVFMKLTCLYETNKKFYFKNQTDLRKSFNCFWSAFKMKAKSAWTLFNLFFTSAVIWKQRLLRENEIVQCLQNCKYQDINQGHFRKP